MPSPFPGMNPYFESPDIWEDFHQNLATNIQLQLNPKLRPKYYASLVPRVIYEEILITDKAYNAKPDVGVWRQTPLGSVAVAPTLTLTPPPVIETIPQDAPVKLWTVEIHEAGLATLITSIEILSPVNKKSGHKGYSIHTRKRKELMNAGVNLLEIDLLRVGKRWTLPNRKLPDAPYFAFLWRSLQPDLLGIWPLKLREAIPLLPVPLRDPDPDVPLDLMSAIHTIYEQASYDMRIDYRQPPPKPNFSEEEQAWIRQVVLELV